MEQWHKTGCVLCAQNCGLQVLVENNRMVKVKPDKDNPRSRGYACRKGLNVIYHQYPADRITTPTMHPSEGVLQEIAEAIGDVRAPEKLVRIEVLGGSLPPIDLSQVGCEFGLLIVARGHIWVRDDDLSPGLRRRAGVERGL